MAGGVIAVGLYVSLDKGDQVTCGQLRVGMVSDIRKTLETDGPSLRSGGNDCGFLLALEGNDIVAYRLEVPGRTCLLQPRGNELHCGNEAVDPNQLQRYPTSIESTDGIDAVVVDLRPVSTTPRDRWIAADSYGNDFLHVLGTPRLPHHV